MSYYNRHLIRSRSTTCFFYLRIVSHIYDFVVVSGLANRARNAAAVADLRQDPLLSAGAQSRRDLRSLGESPCDHAPSEKGSLFKSLAKLKPIVIQPQRVNLHERTPSLLIVSVPQLAVSVLASSFGHAAFLDGRGVCCNVSGFYYHVDLQSPWAVSGGGRLGCLSMPSDFGPAERMPDGGYICTAQGCLRLVSHYIPAQRVASALFSSLSDLAPQTLTARHG